MEKEQIINKYIEGIRQRAVAMWIEGNQPTPRWWLERIQGLLKHLQSNPESLTHTNTKEE